MSNKFVRRRPRGHVRQRGLASWEVKADLPRDPLTGGRRTHTCTVRGTRQQAEQKLTALLADIDAGRFSPPARDTVAEVLTGWIESKANVGDNEDSTIATYRHLIDTVLIPRIGDLRVVAVTPTLIEQLIASLIQGDDRHKPYARSTVRQVVIVLRGALAKAHRDDVITKNPADSVQTPKLKRVERTVWSTDQAYQFLQSAKQDPLYPCYALSIYLGPRRGELVGLVWRRVHLNPDGTGIIQIRQQVRLVDGKPQLASTKTSKSRRDIPLPPNIVDILQEHRQSQELQAQAFGWTVTGETPVFTGNDGKALRPDSVYRHFKRLIARLGLPEITLHDLRHVFASLMDETGSTPREKADLMGHVTTQVTDETYTHTSQRARSRAIDRAARALQDRATVDRTPHPGPTTDESRAPKQELGFEWPLA